MTAHKCCPVVNNVSTLVLEKDYCDQMVKSNEVFLLYKGSYGGILTFLQDLLIKSCPN